MARKLPEVDPLAVLPIRYEDRRRPVPLDEFRDGEPVLTRGKPKSIHIGPKVTTITMDGIGGEFLVKFMRMPAYYEALFDPRGNGWPVLIWGTPKRDLGDTWSFFHPSPLKSEDIGRIVPVYKTPKGISIGRFSRHVQDTAEKLAESLEDEVPEEILKQRGLPSISQAIRAIHKPVTLPDEKPLLRFAYREMFELKSKIIAFPRPKAPELIANVKPYLNTLPWELTADQKRCINEIIEDMAKPRAMRRILVGDVGCGKTEVAMAAAYIATQCGYRTLVLSPTTVLARQTYERFKKYLGADKVSLYIGNKKGNPSLVIVGTQAIMNRKFSGVGLIIIDEQHKTGVSQRNSLLGDGEVHALQMTATPIPRTMGLLVKGAVDLSVIRNSPFKRDVRTKVVPKGETNKILGHIRQVIDGGGKALVIYPLVDAGSEHYKGVENVKDAWEQIFPGRVAYVHGQLEDKLDVVQEFRESSEKGVLVATSLIEIGVDIPEASILVVAGAERFGLAQLHQLRGRIGRRGNKSTCYFMYKKEGSEERLRPLEQLSDGFRLAELDSDQRGWGDAFGLSQAGNCYRLPDIGLYKKVIAWVDEDVRGLTHCDRPVGAAH